jgi:hypothetical protein
LYQVHTGHENPQLAGVRGFYEQAVAGARSRGANVTDVYSMGHSNGGPSAWLSSNYAAMDGMQTHTLMIEPFKGRAQVDAMTANAGNYGLDVNTMALVTANTVTTFATDANGQRNFLAASMLGQGVGQQTFVRTGGGDSIQDAIANHDVANIASNLHHTSPASPQAQVTQSSGQQQGMGSIGEMIMGLFAALFSGGGLEMGNGMGQGMEMLAGLFQNFASQVSPTPQGTAPGSGVLAARGPGQNTGFNIS